MSKARELANLGNAYSDGALSNRNMVINGSFLVWQRGTLQTISGYGSVDRWQVVNITSASRQTDAPSGFQYSIHIENSSASSPFIAQKWEAANVQHLSGADITLSFWAKSVSGTASLFAEILTPNTVDDYSAVTARENTAWATPSTAWTKYTYTFTNVNAAVLNGLEIRIGLQNQSAGSIRITGVQLEIGDSSTPFEHRSYADQLQACQRYFHQTAGYAASLGGGVSHSEVLYHSYSKGASTWEHLTTTFPVTMRAAPTITTSDASGNTGKISHFTSTGGSFTTNHSPYSTYATRDGFKCSDYNTPSIYGFSYDYRADAEL